MGARRSSWHHSNCFCASVVTPPNLSDIYTYFPSHFELYIPVCTKMCMCVQCIELNITTSCITQVECYLSDHSRGLRNIFCSLSCPGATYCILMDVNGSVNAMKSLTFTVVMCHIVWLDNYKRKQICEHEEVFNVYCCDVSYCMTWQL